MSQGEETEIVAVAVVPSSTHSVPNEQPPTPDMMTAIRFCIFQFQVSVDPSVMENDTFVAVPLAGTLPVPVQPVQTYRIPDSASGVETEAAMEVPGENAWLPEKGLQAPCCEAIVRMGFHKA